MLFVDVTEKMWRLMMPHNACECWCCQCTMSMHRLFLWSSEISYIIVVCLFSVPGSRRRCYLEFVWLLFAVTICPVHLIVWVWWCLYMLTLVTMCYAVVFFTFLPNLHVMYSTWYAHLDTSYLQSCENYCQFVIITPCTIKWYQYFVCPNLFNC